MDSKLRETSEPTLLAKLSGGQSLVSICKADDMPNRSTVQRWQDDDEEFNAAVTRAREIGYTERADQAVEDAKNSHDASLGRLAFDAERWYLGKLSNAFSDNKEKTHTVKHGVSTEVQEWLKTS